MCFSDNEKYFEKWKKENLQRKEDRIYKEKKIRFTKKEDEIYIN